MVPADLFDTLVESWQTICDAYDVTAELPDMQTLFEGADLSDPARTSEALLANMLSAAVECIGRFSPWYRQPAGAFGLTLARDSVTHRPRWVLSPEAIRQRQALLAALRACIERHIGLILAANLVDDLDRIVETDDPCVMASCRCDPPRTILVNRSVIARAEIVCDACQQPFRVSGAAPDADAWPD